MEHTVLYYKTKSEFFAKYFELCCTIHHQWRNEKKRVRGWEQRRRGGWERRLVRKRLGERVNETTGLVITDQRWTQRGSVPPPPSFPTVQQGQSIVRSTGSQISVFTYAPMSSFSPFPGPLSFFRISSASLTLRLYASWFLFFPCMVVMTDMLVVSNGRSHSWWCWDIPEWCQFSLWIAWPCSFHRRLHALAVWPM